MIEEIELTPEEKKNGWTVEKLIKYRAQQDKAAGRVGGNVITAWKRGAPPVRIMNSKNYDPFTRKEK